MIRFIILALMACALCVTSASAQFGGGPIDREPVLSEPDENGDRLITFMTYSKEPIVGLVSPDLFPDSYGDRGEKMTMYEANRFITVIGPVSPGVYRYRFTSDLPGLSRQLRFPDKTLQDLRAVPHGVVAAINYYSDYQRAFAQFHVYTPPGYERDDKSYPLLYIFCRGGESSEAWGQLSRANLILDNLIAAGKAQPMIIVLCNQPDVRFTHESNFGDEIRAYVEKNYRALPGAENRAIVGNSIVNFAFQEAEQFGYIANFDYAFPPVSFLKEEQELVNWRQQHARQLSDAKRSRATRLWWFGYPTGFEQTAKVDELALLLARHNFPVEVYRSNKTNLWQNRRDYLIELLPKLFQPPPAE